MVVFNIIWQPDVTDQMSHIHLINNFTYATTYHRQHQYSIIIYVKYIYICKRRRLRAVFFTTINLSLTLTGD